MSNVTDWLATVIAGGAAIVSLWAARDSRSAAKAAKAADQRRERGRAAIAAVMDAGLKLQNEAFGPGRRPDPGEFQDRYEAWEQDAHAAVELADSAQLPRYHADLTSPRGRDVIPERIARLQEIQDDSEGLDGRDASRNLARLNNYAISEQASGSAQWQAFFDARRRGESDAISRELWGFAEQRATDYGNGVALDAGLRPDNVAEVAVGLGTGNIFRAEISNSRIVSGAATLFDRIAAGRLPSVSSLVTAYFDPTAKGPIYASAKVLYFAARAVTDPGINPAYQFVRDRE